MKDLTLKQKLLATKYVFIFLFAMISLNSYAQDDESTQFRIPNRPEEKWDMFHNELITFRFLSQSADGHRAYCRADGSGYSPSYHRTIDEKDYFRIVIYTPNSDFYWYDYREEGEKLYRYNEEKKQDELFMDFGLNVGDVFDRPDGVKLLVVEVGDTLMNEYDGALKVLKLEGVDDKSVQDKWVECFGSVKTGIMLADDLPGYHITDMLYVEKENYNSDLTKALNRGIYNEISNSYLCSARFTLSELMKDNGATKQNLTYDNGDGWILKFSSIVHYEYVYYFIFLESDNILRKNSIPCGDYSLRYSSSQQTFNANIDINFSSGTYSLYDASGNYVQDVTIDGDANAIDNINAIPSLGQGSGLLFDLTGRRLSTAPQHGIYIQNGRKVFK